MKCNSIYGLKLTWRRCSASLSIRSTKIFKDVWPTYEAKLVSKQGVLTLITCSSKVVEWSKTILSKLTIFSFNHWIWINSELDFRFWNLQELGQLLSLQTWYIHTTFCQKARIMKGLLFFFSLINVVQFSGGNTLNVLMIPLGTAFNSHFLNFDKMADILHAHRGYGLC